MSESVPELEGMWEMIRGELAGEEAPELVVQKTEMELAAGSYFVRFYGEIVDRGSYELGTSLEMKSLILHGKEGTNAGRRIPCIYQLARDRLRVCYGLDSVAPSAFVAANTNGRFLATYRRKLK